MPLRMTASADTRYSFTAQFIHGAAIFTRHVHELAKLQPFPEARQSEHRAYVVAAVTHAVFAIEAESAEILLYGPGHHLGSDHRDHQAIGLLTESYKKLEKASGAKRCDLILKLLSRPSFDSETEPYISAALLVSLRNALVHYKSRWGAEMKDSQSALTKIENLGFPRPPFATQDMNFFPHRCLSASLASWSVITSKTFLFEFYKKLGVSCPLINNSYDFSVP